MGLNREVVVFLMLYKEVKLITLGGGQGGLARQGVQHGPPGGGVGESDFLNIFYKFSAIIVICAEKHSSRVGNGYFVVAIYRPWRQKFAEVAIIVMSSSRNPTGASSPVRKG